MRRCSTWAQAATAAFETWVASRTHQASFGDLDDIVLDDLAAVLRDVLYGLRRALDDPPCARPSGTFDRRPVRRHTDVGD